MNTKQSQINRWLNKYWVAIAPLLAVTPLVLTVVVSAPTVGN